MGRGNPSRNAQAEATPLDYLAVAQIASKKRIENSRQLLWRDARTRIGNGHFGILAGTVVLFMLIPKGFIPSQDIGQTFATTEAAQGVSFDEMVTHQKQVAEIIAADTNIFTPSRNAR